MKESLSSPTRLHEDPCNTIIDDGTRAAAFTGVTSVNDKSELLFSNKVILSGLVELHLVDLKNLTNISYGKLPESFCSLRVLEVDNCDKLETVVSFHSLLRLQKLENLIIRRCGSLKFLVDVDENSFKDGERNSLLPRLVKLELSNLPMLTDILRNNPGGKSTEIEQVLFSLLEELNLENLDSLKRIFHSQPPENFCHKLRVMKVESCGTLEALLPFNLFGRSQKLEKFIIKRCDSLRWLFEPGGDASVEGNAISQCPPFVEMVLAHLPRLTGRDIQLPPGAVMNLKSLQIIFCGDLEALFSVSTARCLEHLEILKVYGCDEIEEIIYDYYHGDNEEKLTIMFPKLSCLILKYLPDLGCFYSGNCAIEWPSLEIVRVNSCPEMEYFAQEHQTTPRLRTVDVSFARKFWMGNLNETVLYLSQHNELEGSGLIWKRLRGMHD